MTVLLDPYHIPETGEFELFVRRKIDLKISAAEAQKRVNRWLLHEVSYMMGAGEAELVVGENNEVWRVPVQLTASHIGLVGIVGHVDVTIDTGNFDDTDVQKQHLLATAQSLASNLPPYQSRTEMPAGYANLHIRPTYKSQPPSGDPVRSLASDARSVPL
ncbi:MAG: hypothetical protein R3A44_09145 [Caldilineaceae bacterium]